VACVPARPDVAGGRGAGQAVDVLSFRASAASREIAIVSADEPVGHHRVYQQRTQIAQITLISQNSRDANSRWSPRGLRNLRNLRNLSNLRRLLE
jgi:hypothetical protein